MKKQTRSIMENLALLSQVGIMMVVPIFFCIWLGQFIDKKLNTGSLFLIIGIILGVGAAFRNLYQLAMQKSKEYESHDSPDTYVKKFEAGLKKSNEENASKDPSGKSKAYDEQDQSEDENSKSGE